MVDQTKYRDVLYYGVLYYGVLHMSYCAVALASVSLGTKAKSIPHKIDSLANVNQRQ